MDGFGSHTFQWVNAKGERFWVKFHFKTEEGIRCLTTEQAARIGGQDPAFIHKDLYDAIARREFPAWTLKVQVMPEREAAAYRFNPFDLTKVWPHKDYPLIPLGRMALDRVPENYFAEVEQAAFDPAKRRGRRLRAGGSALPGDGRGRAAAPDRQPGVEPGAGEPGGDRLARRRPLHPRRRGVRAPPDGGHRDPSSRRGTLNRGGRGGGRASQFRYGVIVASSM